MDASTNQMVETGTSNSSIVNDEVSSSGGGDDGSCSIRAGGGDVPSISIFLRWTVEMTTSQLKSCFQLNFVLASCWVVIPCSAIG